MCSPANRCVVRMFFGINYKETVNTLAMRLLHNQQCTDKHYLTVILFVQKSYNVPIALKATLYKIS